MNFAETQIGMILIQTIMMAIGAVGATIVLGLILGCFERKSIANIQRTVGYKGIIFTAPGVIIHELSHYVTSKIFGYKIIEVKLFRPVEGARDGILGYVKSSFNPNNLIQRIGMFFVAFAPIWGGSVSIIIFLRIFMRDSCNMLLSSARSVFDSHGVLNADFVKVQFELLNNLIGSLFTLNNIMSINFWIFIYFAICISSHMALSKADLQESKIGLITILAVFLLVNIVCNVIGLEVGIFYKMLSIYNTVIITLLNIAMVFSLIHLIVTKIVRIILKK